MSEFYLDSIGETSAEAKRRKRREKKLRQKVRKEEERQQKGLHHSSHAKVNETSVADVDEKVDNDQPKHKIKSEKKEKSKETFDELDDFALLDQLIQKNKDFKQTSTSTSSFSSTKLAHNAAGKEAARKALKQRMALDKKSRCGKRISKRSSNPRTDIGGEPDLSKFMGSGGAHGLAGLMNNPAMMEMAQKVMAQNPHNMGRAERMMGDTNAMQRVMSNASMQATDRNVMHTSSTMNLERNKRATAELENLLGQLEDLEFEEEIQASKTIKDPSYEHLGNQITNLMLELDKVDVTGNEPLRQRRKAAINRASRLGDKVTD